MIIIQFVLLAAHLKHKLNETHITVRYRSYKTFQESIFLSDLSDKLADLEYTQNDLDQNFKNWNDIFASVINKQALIKIKELKRQSNLNGLQKISSKFNEIEIHFIAIKTGQTLNIGEMKLKI